jgi:deoxyadenosine/deoxycytidine kinase
MIIVFEGMEKCGKSTTISKLNYRLNEHGIKCQIYDHWHKTEPNFRRSNPFMDRCFEDVVLSDLLFSVKLDSILIFDRSLISGIVYSNWRLKNDAFGDLTYDPRYLDFWSNSLHNGVNGPLYIIYVNVDNIFDVLGNDSSKCIVCNTIDEYKQFFQSVKIFDKLGIETIKISYEKDFGSINNTVEMLYKKIINIENK